MKYRSGWQSQETILRRVRETCRTSTFETDEEVRLRFGPYFAKLSIGSCRDLLNALHELTNWFRNTGSCRVSAWIEQTTGNHVFRAVLMKKFRLR